MSNAEISLTGSLSGAKLTITNPDSDEGTVLNVSPSVANELEAIFPDIHNE